MIYTLVGKPFIRWVEERIKERNLKVEEKNDMTVYLDREIANILERSNTVSGKYMHGFPYICVVDVNFYVYSDQGNLQQLVEVKLQKTKKQGTD